MNLDKFFSVGGEPILVKSPFVGNESKVLLRKIEIFYSMQWKIRLSFYLFLTLCYLWIVVSNKYNIVRKNDKFFDKKTGCTNG